MSSPGGTLGSMAAARSTDAPSIPPGSRRRPVALIVFGTALAGLLGGHVATYLLVEPAHHARDALLHRTGHGYLSAAVAVGLALGLIAALSTAAAGYRRARSVARGPVASAPSWPTLFGLQALAFVAIEVAERLISGAGSSHLGAILVVGLAVQGVAATVGVVLLRLLARVGEAIGHLVARRSIPAFGRPRHRWAPGPAAPVRPASRRPGTPRAPPLPSI
jgi:hypothetical protein